MFRPVVFGCRGSSFVNVLFFSRRRTFSSSVYVPGVYEVVKEFNVSLTVALLGISMYVVGLGLGYVRVSVLFHQTSLLTRDKMQSYVQRTIIRG